VPPLRLNIKVKFNSAFTMVAVVMGSERFERVGKRVCEALSEAQDVFLPTCSDLRRVERSTHSVTRMWLYCLGTPLSAE